MRNNIASFLQRYGLTVLIALFILAVVGVIGWETGWARYWTPGVPKLDGAPRKPDEIALLPPFTLPPVDPTYKETVERPLFNQTRRPNPPAVATAPAAPAMEKGKYRLAGTAVNKELSAAFLIDNRTGKTLRVSKGAPVDPFGGQAIVLANVEPTSVTLQLGGDSEVLTLTTAKSSAAPPQMAQVTAPQPASVPGGINPNTALPQPVPNPVPGQPLLGGPLPPTNSFGPGGPFASGASGGAPPPAPPQAGTGVAPPAPPLSAGAGPTPPAPGATSAPPASDPNATTIRRRRFQNLPQ